MSRLTLRQRLIAVAVGIAAAVLQANTPSLKAAHANAGAATVPVAKCSVETQGNC